ncbi:hypothetical protein OH460_08715 [Vibrio sp. Makdt]|uniref:hypothetical protein n=1 Tax=Vibrio sp. Makdt TaxID=2998828 RepID=UPI0022CD6408|nr:hypothetical protein [Vibrio sp. Makdt]MDA0152383.1 hypothetical protein [Vibrio sp. Makdt]
MKRATTSLFLALASFWSSGAIAFSYDSYTQILAAAQRADKQLVAVMAPSEDINFHSYQTLPYNPNKLHAIYSKYGRHIPTEVRQVLSKKGYDQTQFVLRSGGFGKVLINNIPNAYAELYQAAKAEKEIEIKLALTAYLTHLTVQSYQPISKVVFFDHREFSRGDGGGAQYCLFKAKNTSPKCRYNLRRYWFSYLDGYTFDVESNLPPLPIETVIENAANQSVYAYSVRPYTIPSPAYREKTFDVLSNQADLAASHILYLWRDIFTTY